MEFKNRFRFPSIDMYSKRIGFFYNGSEKISSFFGLFLTLAYIFVSLTLFIYEIIKSFQREELRVYDSTMHGTEMPSIDINSEQFYFAFGLEDPSTSTRFIDDRIYIPRIVFVDKVKINDELVTANQITLEYEKCKVEKFGEKYQSLFIKNELDNSYCLKDTNFNLTLAGGYKYDRMTYLRIRIYPCVNSTENNNSCKPQEVIDRYLSSGFFSILIKDFGLNPLNYNVPILPTLQDLYTTIDKGIMRNYILNFRITEINTDIGIISENIKREKYLQYFKELQTFTFRDEQDYYNGKSIILVQMKLDDTIFIQTRIYTKISEIFSRIGGYMQLMNTAFLLLSTIINRLHSGFILINSIFKFGLKENNIILKYFPLKEINTLNLKNNNNYTIIYSNNFKNEKLEYDKSKNNLINNNLSSFFNVSKYKSNAKFKNKKKIFKNNSIAPNEVNSVNSINSNFKQNGDNVIYIKKENIQNNYLNNGINSSFNPNDYINLNLYEYIFCRKNKKMAKLIKLYNFSKIYYKKKMDIVHIFTLLCILEKNFPKIINQNIYNHKYS